MERCLKERPEAPRLSDLPYHLAADMCEDDEEPGKVGKSRYLGKDPGSASLLICREAVYGSLASRRLNFF